MANRDDELKDNLKKMRELYFLLVKWMTIQQQGRDIAGYFKRNSYQKVAIYGMKEVGILVYDALDKANIDIAYVVDKNADYMNLDINADMFTPEDPLPEVDIIVVTAIHYFESIKQKLSDKVKCPIISLLEVINQS